MRKGRHFAYTEEQGSSSWQRQQEESKRRPGWMCAQIFEKKVDDLKDGVAAVKADVNVIRSDLGHVQEDVTSLKVDVGRVDAKVDALGANPTNIGWKP